MPTRACPRCDHAIALSEAAFERALEKTARCPACKSALRVVAGDGGEFALIADEFPSCRACGLVLRASETFCPECGAPLGAAIAPPAPETAVDRKRRRLADYASKERAKQVRNAGRWMIAIAALFLLVGSFAGFIRKREADSIERSMAGLSDDARSDYAVHEKELTVGDVRSRLRGEVVMVFLSNYVLAAIMIGCWFWSRRAPLPATVAALCSYLAVVAINAIIAPATLLSGILIKVFFVVGLFGGVRAALAQRAAAGETTTA